MVTFCRSAGALLLSAALLLSTASGDLITFDFSQGGNSDPGDGNLAMVNVSPALPVPSTGGTLSATYTGSGVVHVNNNGLGVAGGGNNRLNLGETLDFSFTYSPAASENVAYFIQELGFPTTGGSQQVQAGDNVTVAGIGAFDGAFTTLDLMPYYQQSATLGSDAGDGWRAASVTVNLQPIAGLFADGSAHTIPPGTDANINETGGGIGAFVADNGGTATSLSLGAGGAISVETSGGGTDAVAVVVTGDSSFTYSGGTLLAHDDGGAGYAIGVQAFDDADVTISGSDSFRVWDQGADHAYGVFAAAGSPTITVSGTIDEVRDQGDNSARGIQLEDNTSATVNVTASGVFSDIRDQGDGAAYGIFAQGGGNSSTIDFAGDISLREAGAGTAHGVRTQGTSSANVSGTLSITEASGGDANGIVADDDSTVTYSGSISIDEAGGGAARGVQANDNASVSVSGSIDIVEAGGGSSRVFQANDATTMYIQTGFEYGNTQADAGNARLGVANDDSYVLITGGDLANQTGSNQQIDINDDALVEIAGGDFAIDGMPVDLSTGDSLDLLAQPDFALSGQLSDGTAFDNVLFAISDNGILRLTATAAAVPEPDGLALWFMIGVSATVCLGKRRCHLFLEKHLLNS